MTTSAVSVDDRPAVAARLSLTYLVPLRTEVADADLAGYLHRLVADITDVVVVDGSPRHIFDAHARMLPADVRHLPPTVQSPNGKVGGVLTGVSLARHEVVVVADDDVRWDRCELERAVEQMGDAEAAIPQNRFEPAPWHARWDTGRTLVNRAFGGDWPGTIVVRAGALDAGYAGDVLFENLELVRTIKARAGEVKVLLDLVVTRRPPTTSRFLEQRVRQAYDELARPWRLVVQLSLLPIVLRWRLRGAVAVAGTAIGLAEIGRRTSGGRAHWGPAASWWAALWTAERSVTSWLAVITRLRGGVRYRDARLRIAAHSKRTITARLAVRP